MNMTVTGSSQNSQTAQRRSLPGYCLKEESVLSVSTPFPASFLIISNTQHFLLDINSVAIDPGLFSYPNGHCRVENRINEGYSQRACMLAPWSQGFPTETLVLKGQSGNQGHKTQAPGNQKWCMLSSLGAKVDTKWH